MSKQLLIFRHAKSGWDANSDHERTLTEHGVQQAKFMGDLIQEKGIHPDLVICSSAARAVSTMELAMEAGQWLCDSTVTDALYETNVDAVIELLKQLGDDKVVMLIGHEPTWSELASALTKESVSFGTAGMCSIQISANSWQQIGKAEAILEWYEQP